jgi:hypothetical protein
VPLPCHLWRDGERIVYNYGTFKPRHNHPDHFNVPNNSLSLGEVLEKNAKLEHKNLVLEAEIVYLKEASRISNTNSPNTTTNNNNTMVNLCVKPYGKESMQHLERRNWNSALTSAKGSVGKFTIAAIDMVHEPPLNHSFYVDPAEPNQIFLRSSEDDEFHQCHLEEVAARAPNHYMGLAHTGGANAKMLKQLKRKADMLDECIPSVVKKLREKGLVLHGLEHLMVVKDT